MIKILNIAEDLSALVAAEQILKSQLIDFSAIDNIIDGSIHYPEEFLDLYRLMPAEDQRWVLPIFDVQYYLSTNPDIVAQDVDPLIHFMTTGISELRSPHPLVDLRAMIAARTDLFGGRMILRDFIDAIVRNLCDPGPYFSIDEYSSSARSSLPEDVSAFMHFLTTGAERGARPNDFLDPDYYASRYDDVPGRGLAAVLHFVEFGDQLARQPSAEFDPVWYRAHHRDVTNTAPLLHFLAVGRAAGRKPRASELDDDVGDDDVGAERLEFSAELPRENAQEMQRRYNGFVRKMNALAHERRARFRTRDARPVYLDDPEQELAGLGFPDTQSPQVDILIPCFNEFEYTVECLVSISRAEISVPYRVIVADDASTDPRMAKLSQVEGLIHLDGTENRHFLRNCNAAFSNVTAEYLLLLNNDAQLAPGCIDELVRVLDEEPDAAAAAPMILYPNGRLQEAGARYGSTEPR